MRLSVIFKSLKGIALLSSSGEQIRRKTLVTFDSNGSIHGGPNRIHSLYCGGQGLR